MTWLLDGNVLVALRVTTHLHHDRANRWFATLGSNRFATCAVTQGTFLRLHMRLAADASAGAAWTALEDMTRLARHVFWEDAFSYLEVLHTGLHGPSQVTDAWLAELARRRKGRLATLDSD